MNSEAHLELWAKDTGETMLTHSLNVVRVAQQVCANLPFAPKSAMN